VRHSAAVQFDAEYLLHVPPAVDHRTLLVLTLHGYGSNPETMLRLSETALGGDAIIASVRAPNQHYLTGLRAGPPSAPVAGSEVGYNWGTIRHAALNIELHHRIVRAISAELRARFEVPQSRVVLMGFSQPVGLNYRFIGTYPQEAAGVIAMCGGVPKDWEEDKYGKVAAPILHIARSEDEFFPDAVSRRFPDRLRAHAANVEFHMLPGQHRFPSKAGAIIREFANKIRSS
jgi:predicted esterase